MENEIRISKAEYDALSFNNNVLDFLADALTSSARLDYSGKRLSFDDNVIDTVFSILLPKTYKATLTTLQVKKKLETEG